MPKRGSLGDIPDFGKQGSVPKIGKLRQGQRVSPQVPKREQPFPKDGNCEQGITDPVNTSSCHPGRQQGESILYSPSQDYNYQRMATRYQRALERMPSFKSEDENNNPVWGFCSSRAPDGYWRVRVAKSCSYVDVGDYLILSCPPRGYRLTQVKTDCDRLVWTQLSGRLVALDPPDAPQPELIILDDLRSLEIIKLRATLPNDPLNYDDLLIYTVPTSSLFVGVGANGIEQAPDFAPCRLVPCRVTPVPQRPGDGYQWLDGTIPVTWELPECKDGLIQTRWQINSVGRYEDAPGGIFDASSPRRFSIRYNTYYRIVADFDLHGLGVASAVSDTCRFFFDNVGASGQLEARSRFFTDDRTDGISLTGLGGVHVQYDLDPIILATSDRTDGMSLGGLGATDTQYPLTAANLEPQRDTQNGVSLVGLGATVTHFTLSGVTIG